MEKMFSGITGGLTQGRKDTLEGIMARTGLPIEAFSVEECTDERTGVRYGNAQVRKGFAYKLGGGGRNRGSRYAYQVWAVVRPEYRR